MRVVLQKFGYQMNRPRRFGVVTAVCNACLTPNGIRLGLHYHQQTAFYQCYNLECRKHNRVIVSSVPVNLNAKYLESAQQGVQVHGVENA